MTKLLIYFLVNGLSVFITANLLQGVKIKGYGQALIATIAISLTNMFLKPLLLLFTFPVTVLTLGLWVFVVDAIMVMFVSAFVPGFKIKNLGWALVFSILLSIINGTLHWLLL